MGAAAALVITGFAWSALDPGALPGDLAVARAVQNIFGTEPVWARWLTDTAKFPTAWVTLALAATLAILMRGWRGALSAGAAFAVAHGLDKLLRLVVFAPRPTADVVAVASPASSSGLPSTFGLVFGALFGLTLVAALGRRSTAATAIALFSALLLLAGFAARVALGGHWPSQMLLSLVLGGLAGAMMLGLAAETGVTKRKRR